MINRKELAEEITLRENVRRAIGVIIQRRNKQNLLERKNEEQLRDIVRSMLAEGQAAVASVAKHDSTGINTLEENHTRTIFLMLLKTR